ncbi:hypothetical protein QJR52_06160 [Clostridium baratii]|uniref:hypothetical protein n=1 Tax=Clostridium baratii TaxID=1561 RepID=UPI0030D4465B
MILQKYEDELSNLIPEATDLIKADFNYKKDIAVEIKLAEEIKDKNYCNDITLQIRLVGILDKKYNIIEKTMDIDKILNQFRFSNNDWIVRENVWYTSYVDEEKFNTVLMYKIRNYK